MTALVDPAFDDFERGGAPEFSAAAGLTSYSAELDKRLLVLFPPQTLPKIHIVLASLEKVVPTLEDAATILRVLARSATGQEMSVYTTLSTGPRRKGDPDGPEEYHVILLDNGRSTMLGKSGILRHRISDVSDCGTD